MVYESPCTKILKVKFNLISLKHMKSVPTFISPKCEFCFPRSMICDIHCLLFGHLCVCVRVCVCALLNK